MSEEPPACAPQDGDEPPAPLVQETETGLDARFPSFAIDDELEAERLLEALLFASAEPISERHLAQRLPEDMAVAPLLERIRAHYEGRGVELVRRGDAWALRTAPDLGDRLAPRAEPRKLSRAAFEVLGVIAYHQPVTRADIEAMRGVTLAKGTLDHLLQLGWIRPGGRRETPGRPLTWVTTQAFLDHFGLESLKALPSLSEMKAAGLLDPSPVLKLGED